MLRVIISTFIFYGIGYCQHEGLPPGLAVSINQKSLDYLVKQAEDLIPEMLHAIPIPRSINETGGFVYDYYISGIEITDVPVPTITAEFIQKEVIRVIGILPSISMKAHAFIDGYWDIESDVTGETTNATAEIDVDLSTLQDGMPQPGIPLCKFDIKAMTLIFHNSTALSVIGPFIEVMLRDMLNDLINKEVCQLLVNAVSRSGSCDDPEEANACDSKSNDAMSDFTYNLRAKQVPAITHHNAVLFLDGMISYKGREPRYLQGNWTYENRQTWNKHSVNIFVSDRVLNNFFYLAYENKMTEFNQDVSSRELPPILRDIVSIVCGTCSVNLRGNLYDAPTVAINSEGAMLTMVGWLRARYTFWNRRVTLFTIAARIKAKITPAIVINKGIETLTATAETTQFDIEFLNTGLTNVAGVVTNKLIRGIEEMVPRKLKPMIDKRLKWAFRPECGVPLIPSFCGIGIPQSKLRLIEHAVVIDANITYSVRDLVMPAIANIDESDFNSDVTK